MSDRRPDFWFYVKSYGWGWGFPARWQGWVVLLAYFGLLIPGVIYLEREGSMLVVLLFAAVLTVLLVLIIALKGERPLGWRWGGK